MGTRDSSNPGTYEHWKCATCKAEPGELCEGQNSSFGENWRFAHLDRHQKASFARLYPEVLCIPCTACKAPAGQPCTFRISYCGDFIRPEPCEARRAKANHEERPKTRSPEPGRRT